MDEKILKILDLLYSLDLSEKNDFSNMISNLDEIAKKEMLIAVFKRYESYSKNMKNLKQKLNFIVNDLWDIEESIEANKINLDY